MSEYWKSTPKYWCKHCKTFVRDTKLEKQNHEATPKHQGNLKRFLRDLHRGHEREERDAQRAKDEVARLNGVVSGSSSGAAGDGGAPWKKKPVATSVSSMPRQATAADRKQQLKQLAEMGVAVPDEFRKEMAMAGDWETFAQRIVYNDVKQEADSKDSKPEGSTTVVPKRRHDTLEEDDEAEERVARKAWGSTTRTYPDARGTGDDDLDSLLQNTRLIKREDGVSCDDSNPKNALTIEQLAEVEVPQAEGALVHKAPLIKKESSDPSATVSTATPHLGEPGEASIKTEDGSTESGIVFKKRKVKQTRHR